MAIMSLGDPTSVIQRLEAVLEGRCEVEGADDGSIVVTIPSNGIELEVWPEREPPRVVLELFVAVPLARVGETRDMEAIERRCRELIEGIYGEHWRAAGWELAADHVWDRAASTPTAHDDLLLYEVALGKAVSSLAEVVAAVDHVRHAEHFVELRD